MARILPLEVGQVYRKIDQKLLSRHQNPHRTLIPLPSLVRLSSTKSESDEMPARSPTRTSLPGVEATISMEIEIKVPGGVEGHVVRIVKENANALNFEDALFEDE